MTIKELTAEYDNDNFFALKDYATGKRIQIKNYISHNVKVATIESLLDSITYKVDGIYEWKEINKMLSFILTVIKLYTDLEFSEDPIADYDSLQERGLVEEIVNLIGSDYDLFLDMYNMAFTDIQRKNNIETILNDKLTSITDSIDLFLSSIINKIDSLDSIMNIDSDSIKQLIDAAKKAKLIKK